MRLHDDARQGVAHTGFPRTFRAHHVAGWIQFLRVLAKVPDVPGLILREPVERVLLEKAVNINRVHNFPARYAHDFFCAARDMKSVPQEAALLAAFVNEART